MSPVGAIFVPFLPQTGTNMLHPRPPPPIVELALSTVHSFQAKYLLLIIIEDFLSLVNATVRAETSVSSSCIRILPVLRMCHQGIFAVTYG